jgi:hypothetical protein
MHIIFAAGVKLRLMLVITAHPQNARRYPASQLAAQHDLL